MTIEDTLERTRALVDTVRETIKEAPYTDRAERLALMQLWDELNAARERLEECDCEL